jgi:hypothetical protein
VVCHGNGCSVLFSSVQFHLCTLVVLAGAHASVKGCTFTNGMAAPDAGKAGAVAHGFGSDLHMHSSTISGGLQVPRARVLSPSEILCERWAFSCSFTR